MNRNTVVFTATLLAMAVAAGWVSRQLADPSFLVLILSALAVATWLVYWFIQKTRPGDFIKNYLLTIVLKLLAGGIFIFILLYADRPGADANAILFMAAYFLFTGLEVGFLYRKLK